MTEIVIWLLAFAFILFFSFTRWEASVSPGLDKILPRVIKHDDDNRIVWSLSLAILGATTLVRPVDMLMIAILLGIGVLIARKLACWGLNKADFH
ncbi:hypothetical protein [Billgrantia gudaonensis]|uniref:Uncharacterized protein n=1 Tax=Billgrantia gudaonensis TaxID=376427 RepID=A0A1G8MTQ2_9GAMM|nr:hypothetical protein [Halomonas gudaonensis]SDI71233.1 hypothetical protein SAMN04487954_101112 [Halomonas gudaonensis]